MDGHTTDAKLYPSDLVGEITRARKLSRDLEETVSLIRF